MGVGAKTSPHKQLAESSGKGLRWCIIIVLGGFFLASLVVNGSAAVVPQNEVFPLEPPDTASPRGTLFNLIDNVDEAYRVLIAAERAYQASSGLLKDDEVLARQARADALLRRAGASLDLSRVSPALLRAVKLETVLQLKEVLDRITLPSAEAIPDAQAVGAKGLTRWRIPHTGIDIVQVAEGPRAAEFLFSPETVRQTRAFYQAVEYLPYLTTGTEGFYQRYVSTPGRLLAPKWLAWIADLPAWTQRLYYGQAVWQWTALVLTLLVLLSVLYNAVGPAQGRRKADDNSSTRSIQIGVDHTASPRRVSELGR